MGNQNSQLPQAIATERCSATARGAHPSTEVLLAEPLREEDDNLVKLAVSKGLSATLETTYPPSPEHESSVALYSLRLAG
eukprot:4285515-Pyramimonas_sp.AAC.1